MIYEMAEKCEKEVKKSVMITRYTSVLEKQ